MRIAPGSRDTMREFDTVFAITEAAMGFVPNRMLIMARDPDLLAAFAEISTIILPMYYIGLDVHKRKIRGNIEVLVRTGLTFLLSSMGYGGTRP